MISHNNISQQELFLLFRKKQLSFAGNKKLKIYGNLKCKSGKRMLPANRIFFHDEYEAIENNYRPCAHCLNNDYKKWKMDLFSEHTDAGINLLPNDGTVNYYGTLLSHKEADHYFDVLMKTIEWKNDEAVIFGKHIITKRKVAWYANETFSYTYSNITKEALPWTKELLQLKKLAEEKTGTTYNSCLLNLYHDGDEGMAWHSDDEKTLGKNMAIASLTFGAERKFSFKHKRSKETVSLVLEHGSLLVMKDDTQTNWLHRLPPTTKIKGARINLTFRTMIV